MNSASIAVLAFLSISAMGAAYAQTTAATPTAATGAAGTVQEVVVTAERRTTNIQSTPIAISSLSGGTIANRKIVEISDLQDNTPGLSVTNSGFTQNINIRGLGNGAATPAVTTGVAVFRDGLYEPEPILLNEPFYDIADVAVLRGPQGTIVGQNSTGGAVLINSSNPNFAGINGYIEAEGGNYSEYRFDGAINLPINDQLAARVAFNVRNRDSFYTNLGQERATGTSAQTNTPGSVDEKNVRVSLIYKPNDRFQALAKAEINRLDSGGVVGTPLPPCSTCAADTSDFQYGYAGLKPFQITYAYPEDYRDAADRYSLEMRLKLDGGVTLRSLTGYQHTTELRTDDVGEAESPNEAYQFAVVGPSDDYYQQEFDLISPDSGRLTWLAGASAFYRSTPVHLSRYTLMGGDPVPGTLDNTTFDAYQSSIQRLFGIFGQVTYQLTPSLQIQGGVRYSFDSSQSGGYVEPLGTTVPLVIGLPGHYSDSVPTGKIGLNWTAAPGEFVYVFYARGYKQGGYGGPGDYFNPEFVNDYELGLKSTLLSNHLKTQIGGYYIQYDGLQQAVINGNSGNGGVENIGASTIYGIEASAQANLGNWVVDAGLAYNHSDLGSISAIASYELPVGTSGPQCAAGQTTNCFNYTPYTVSLSGSSNPYSPELTVNTSVSYIYSLGERGTLTPRVNVSYVSDQYASIFQNSDYFLLKARTLVDLSLTYRKGNWSAQGYTKNVLDKTYRSGIYSAFTTNAEYGDPRTYGFSVRRAF